MTIQSQTLLSSQTHSGDSTPETITSDKLQGDGFYGRSDGLHTIQYSTNGYTGSIQIQASLAITPSDTDWFTVLNFTHSQDTSVNIQSFTGNYVWIRAKITFTDGTLNSIILNH